MTYPPHGKPLTHHLMAIALAIAAAVVVSIVLMHDARAASVLLFEQP
jgi:hypothetical protein